MICRKCQNSFDDSMSKCPECGTEVFADGVKGTREKFTVKIPEVEIENLSLDSEAVSVHKENIEVEQTEQPEQEQIEIMAEKPYIERAVVSATAETEKYEPAEYKSEIAQDVAAAKARRSDTVTAPEEKKDSIGDKFAASLIVVLVCILGAMMTVLTVVSVKTDIFKIRGKEIQTVALLGLSDEETVSLEQWLAKVGFVCEKDFQNASVTVNEFLSFIKPYDSNGIYRTFYGEPEFITDAPDPAEYFCDENYNYSYYKLPAENVDSLVELFNLTVNHTVNTDDFYYYGGYYYFRDKIEEDSAAVSYIVDVSTSKKLQDGSFYVKCSFYDSKNLSEPARERYAIVEKNVAESTAEVQWNIKQVSSEAIFDSAGVMITDTGKVNFEIATETIEQKASDGTVYHKYIVEYPVFSGDSEGEQNANRLFSDLAASYRSLASVSAQEEYENYVKYGGSVEELPLITHAVTRVTYNADGYISAIEETADYIPQSMPTEEDMQPEEENEEYDEYGYDYYEDEEYDSYGWEEESAQAEDEKDEPVTLPERTVEGYTFELVSGDFVTKDTFIGKDYQTLSELLYRINGGYSYDDLIYTFEKAAKEAQQTAQEAQAATAEETTQEAETTEEYDDYYDSYDYDDDYYYDEEEDDNPYEYYTEEQGIPEDEFGLGREIYESASALCDKGYLFCYVDGKGIARDVIIPYMSCFFSKALNFEENTVNETETTGVQETTIPAETTFYN